MTKTLYFILLILSHIPSIGFSAERFNTHKLIVLNGHKSELEAGEGYLFLSFHSNYYIEQLKIKPKKSGASIKFNEVLGGQNYALIKLKVGDYYWDKIKFNVLNSQLSFNYNKSEKTFTIKPGVINYPGSWDARLNFVIGNRYRLTFNPQNKSSIEYKAIKILYPELLKKYNFKYQGIIEDNYPSYYEQISTSYKEIPTQTQNITSLLPIIETKKSTNHSTFDVSQGIDKQLKDYQNIKKYFNGSHQVIGNFNPNGDFLVYTSLEEKYTRIEVLHLNLNKSKTIFKEKLPEGAYIDTLSWVDNNSVFYRVIYKGYSINKVSHLQTNELGSIESFKNITIPIGGTLIDALPNEEDMIYFANNNYYSKKKNGLFKINTKNRKSIKKSTKKSFIRLKKLKNAVYWLTDQFSIIRFVIVLDDSKSELLHWNYWFLPPDSKEWVKIKTYASEDEIEVPIHLSLDAKILFSISNNYSDKNAIHMFSTKDFSHQGIYSDDTDVEILSIKTDPSSHEILGYGYNENGFYKIHYFKNHKDNLRSIRKRYPSTEFFSIHHNLNSKKTLIFGSNEYSKGAWYIYDGNKDQLFTLFEVDSVYSKLDKGSFYHLNIESKDNINLEGYLVLPKGENLKDVPLILMPHGGPIGVRDFAYSNEVQHFYASQGFATLRVNFRGSGGFGKKFKQAGQQQWGEKIEEDINEVVDYTLKNFPIAPNKICSMGASYGGYSALMLTILYPQRYQCAVSFAGVTDIPLMFTNHLIADDENLFQKMSEIAGNPMVNYQGLVNKSPLYLTHKMTKPVLLFHGIWDQNVVIEHSLRLKEIADLTHVDATLIELKNEGHSLNNIESKVYYYAKSLDFIKNSL